MSLTVAHATAAAARRAHGAHKPGHVKRDGPKHGYSEHGAVSTESATAISAEKTSHTIRGELFSFDQASGIAISAESPDPLQIVQDCSRRE